MFRLEQIVTAAADWVWGLPLLILLTTSGLYFLVLSRFVPFRHFGHGLAVLTGRYSNKDDPGEVSHFKALSVALAATIGMGNIAGVAVAIQLGGPGAIFWMWVSAIFGMATKYFTCSLAVMYRGTDSNGEVRGGPMYVIVEGLGKRWRPLAVMFCLAGMFGCLPVFNANQLTGAVDSILVQPLGLDFGGWAPFAIGLGLLALTALVMSGGLKRVGDVSVRLVPLMVVLYLLAVAGIVITHWSAVPETFALIISDAFSASHYQGDPLFGGAVGGLIILGFRRAAFSNEAGIGTAPMAHGVARTKEPIREGLVAMLGPVIDTLVICTLTAIAILITGAWQTDAGGGVLLTATAFEMAYPGVGNYILLVCILSFGLSSLFSYSYFGMTCFSFLFGARTSNRYLVFYCLSILLGAVSSLALIINFIDFMFAIMAVPTLLSALLLSPRVLKETRRYFGRPFQRREAPVVKY